MPIAALITDDIEATIRAPNPKYLPFISKAKRSS